MVTVALVAWNRNGAWHGHWLEGGRCLECFEPADENGQSLSTKCEGSLRSTVGARHGPIPHLKELVDRKFAAQIERDEVATAPVDPVIPQVLEHVRPVGEGIGGVPPVCHMIAQMVDAAPHHGYKKDPRILPSRRRPPPQLPVGPIDGDRSSLASINPLELPVGQHGGRQKRRPKVQVAAVVRI